MALLNTISDPGARAAARPQRGSLLLNLLFWAGLLLALLISNVLIDRPGRGPTQRNWNYGRLNREHSFSQTFVVEHDGLVGVRVLLFAGSNIGDGSVTLRLHDAAGDLPDLARATLPLSALDRREMTLFPIQPLTFDFPSQQVTTTVRLELEAPELPPDTWITVMAGPDTYADGELFVDGKARPVADLAFQPVYRGRWLDAFLPISRMAYGKPGLFGWPQFSVLLAYTFLVLLAHTILRLWQAARAAVDAH